MQFSVGEKRKKERNSWFQPGVMLFLLHAGCWLLYLHHQVDRFQSSWAYFPCSCFVPACPSKLPLDDVVWYENKRQIDICLYVRPGEQREVRKWASVSRITANRAGWDRQKQPRDWAQNFVFHGNLMSGLWFYSTVALLILSPKNLLNSFSSAAITICSRHDSRSTLQSFSILPPGTHLFIPFTGISFF